jgi:hypothetical protein
MQFTTISIQISRDPKLVKRCLNRAYINNVTKLNPKSKANKWYTSGDFQEAKMLIENSCPLLNEVINYEAIRLKWYRGSVMPLGCSPGRHYRDQANRLRTISPSVPPADHVIPGLPPSSDKSKMLPRRTPST